MIKFDIAILGWLQNHLIPDSIPFFQFISDTTTLVSVAVVSLILLLSIIKKSKTTRVKVFLLAIVLILVALMSQGLKFFIERDRPFKTYPHIEKLSEAGSSSFPSGHAMEAFALATALSLLFPKKKTIIPVFLWAILVAYSRMALGVHYPSDVLAGILIGILLGWIVPWIFKRTGFIQLPLN